MSYLFGFGGRINRAKMWLFIVVTLVWEIVVGLIAAFGLSWHGWSSGRVVGVAFPWADPIAGPLQMAAAAAIAVLVVVYVVSLLAVFTKRLHDRNKSAWWLILFLFIPCGLSALERAAVPGLLALGEHFGPLGVGLDTADLIGTILGIWAFIELFCLPGTPGENRYGPDPLPAAATAAA